MYIIKLLLSYIAKFVIFLLGWKYITEKQFRKFNKYKRLVMVFSHTTYADFYIFILYFLAYPTQFKNVRVLVKPQPFEYAGFILRRLGCIPSAKFDDRNTGSTERIINELSKQKEFLFLISPKGTIVKSDWRNGYYNVAVALGAHLVVTGLDYCKKGIIISHSISYLRDKSDIDKFLKEQLSKIVPLYPEDEVVEIREHDEQLRSIVDIKRFISIVTFVIFISYVCF